jgi:hypothetical protein
MAHGLAYHISAHQMEPRAAQSAYLACASHSAVHRAGPSGSPSTATRPSSPRVTRVPPRRLGRAVSSGIPLRPPRSPSRPQIPGSHTRVHSSSLFSAATPRKFLRRRVPHRENPPPLWCRVYATGVVATADQGAPARLPVFVRGLDWSYWCSGRR